MGREHEHENNLEAEVCDDNENKEETSAGGSKCEKVMCELKRIGRLRGRGKECREWALRNAGEVSE